MAKTMKCSPEKLAGSWSTTASSIGASGAEAGRDWHSSLSKWDEQRVCCGTFPKVIGPAVANCYNTWNGLRSWVVDLQAILAL